MQILTVISEICSILGFVISLFVASQVLRITNSFNENEGEIQYGEGEKNIVKNHSLLVKENGTATINDYRYASIVGEFDELPVLSEAKYSLSAKNIDFYKEGVENDAFKWVNSQQSDVIVFEADFTNTVSIPETNRWIGYSIKSLPMRDWRSFVHQEFTFEFAYIATGNIETIWIEMTNFSLGEKIYKAPIELKNAKGKFVLRLEQFKNTVEDWKTVDEICFVAFPEECVGQHGTICITDFAISK